MDVVSIADRDPLRVLVPIGRDNRFDPDAAARANGEEPPPDADPAIPDAGPTFTAQHGTCVAAWRAPQFVRIDTMRIAEHRDELSGEVIVRSTVPGLERQLAQRRVPLLGTRAVSDLATYLAKRLRERELDWPELLEAAFVHAVRAHREGDPAIALDTVPARVGPRYAIPGLALADLSTFAWALPGQAKTWLAVAVGCAIQTGRHDILGIEPSAPLRVGFLDWELTEYDVAERARMICGGPAPSITYVRCQLAIWDELDRIERIVREHQLQYLVIDSADMAVGGVPPESSEAALRFNTAMRQLALGAFVTAHTTKDGAENAPFGSTFWLAQLRLGWFLKRDAAVGTGFTLAAFCKKASTDHEPAPIAWSLSFADGRALFERTDVRDAPDLARGVPLRSRLQHALMHGPRIIADVADELEEKPDTVARVLRRYAGKQFVRQAGPDGVDRWANLATEAAS